MTVSGVAATDERISMIEVLLDPLPPGCDTWLEFSVKGEPASGDMRLVVALTGLDDVVEGIEPPVFQRVDPADAATSAVHTRRVGGTQNHARVAARHLLGNPGHAPLRPS